MSLIKIMSFCILLLVSAAGLFAQPIDSVKITSMTREEILELSQDDLLEMSMENLVFLAAKMGISIDELLNMKTNVASKTTLTPRETPGIVSFITEEEIDASGARDLIDVLKMAPGFDFGYDVSGVVGVGLRGNWVHEGKILLLIDGQPMNERSYYNIPFGNHFPVDQIYRVEIIRGPGSAIYGGNAELGVINIITKSGKSTDGVEIAATYGQMQKAMGRSNINLNAGTIVKNWDISAHGFFGLSNRSDQVFYEYIDDKGNILDLSDDGSSEIKTSQFNFEASNKDLVIRFIYDDYKTDYWYYDYDLLQYYKAVNEFRTLNSEVQYTLRVNEKLNFIPKVSYGYNRPYYEEGYWRNYTINTFAGSLIMNYQASEKLNLMAGIESTNDFANCENDTAYFYSSGDGSNELINQAFFGEGTIRLNKINLTAGLRAEHSSAYGWASAPRIGITGIFNKFHFKALFSGSFRTPAIGNIDVSYNLKPEKSFVSEVEVGYRINDNMFVTANFFDIQIKESIVYYDTGSGWNPIIDWGYDNVENAGSNGLELEFKTKYAKFFAGINYAFYTQALRALPEAYAVPGKNSAQGLSQHQIGLFGSYNISDKLALSPSLSIMGKKYSYLDVDDDGYPKMGDSGPFYIMNLALNYKPVKGLGITISVYDLFNQKQPFAHPYYGWYSPYPGRSREILIKLVLHSDLFKKR